MKQVLSSTFYFLRVLLLQLDYANFANWSHQAVDLILGISFLFHFEVNPCIFPFKTYALFLLSSLCPFPEDAIKNILSKGTSIEHVQGIVGSLSLRLVKKMCTTSQGNGKYFFVM